MNTARAVITIIAVVGLLAMACSDRPTPVDDSQPTPAPTSTPVPPTPTPSVVASDDFTDARISMREGGGMLGTVRVHTVDSTLLSYKGNFLSVANQEARTECSATTISPEDQNLLWRTLYESDVFTLGDNNEMLSVVADVSFYAIIVEHDGQRNEFSVYAPGFLADRLEGRYLAIVEAIRDLANLRLRAPSLEACADYQVANQTPEPTPTPVPTTSTSADESQPIPVPTSTPVPPTPKPVDESQPISAPTSTPVPPMPTPMPMPMPNVHRVEIGLGGSVQLPDQGIGISFDEVVEDSRCPANVVCVWAGEAVIELTVTKADTSAVVRLSLEPGSPIKSPWVRVTSSQPGSEDISIRLTSLEPYPGSDADKEGGVLTAVLEVMVDRG